MPRQQNTVPKAPNILLLLSDEHSFRFLGSLPASEGGEAVSTPALDRLAARSAVFTDAYCGSPLCVPSRMTMLTGRDVQRAGAWGNQSILDPALDTIPKLLARAGYATCLVGKMHFQGRHQFHGFQNRPYGDLVGNGSHQYEWAIPWAAGDRASAGEPVRVGDDLVARTRDDIGVSKIPESLTVDRIIAEESTAFLREQRAARPDQPWFLCASFSRPHFPFTAPPRHVARYHPDTISPPRIPAAGDSYEHPVSRAIRVGFQVDRIDRAETMRARAAYFACVSYFDEVVGDLPAQLEASGLLDDTIIVYTSDHGEMAGEHGTWWKSTWNEASTRVPLFVSLPEHRRGELPPRRISTPVSLLDLMPTLAAFAGAPPPEAASGVDLTAAVRGTGDPPDRPIACDHLNARWGPGSEFRMLRWGRYKLVLFGDYDPLLFDLETDPGEQRNLFAADERDVAAAREKLLAAARQNLDFEEVARVRAETNQRLKGLYGFDPGDSMPNQYLLRNGSIVDADAPVYRPRVISKPGDGLILDRPDADNP